MSTLIHFVMGHRRLFSNMIFWNPSGAWYTKSQKLTSIIEPSSTAKQQNQQRDI